MDHPKWTSNNKYRARKIQRKSDLVTSFFHNHVQLMLCIAKTLTVSNYENLHQNLVTDWDNTDSRLLYSFESDQKALILMVLVKEEQSLQNAPCRQQKAEEKAQSNSNYS